MALTVSDLVGVPHLRLELAAGYAGIDAPVTWAHSSDLDAPWQWMTGGELLMKNGQTLPKTASRQAAFLHALADTKISGLVIGLDPHTPELTASALAVAEERRLPIILAPYSVGFAAIGRTVAEANSQEEPRRTTLTERIYNAVRTAVNRPSGEGVLRQLSRDLACRLAVLDAETADLALDGTDPLPGVLRDRLIDEITAREGKVPGVVHLQTGTRKGLVVEVPDEEPTVLVFYDFRAAIPDIGLLQHVATAVGVLLAQQGLRREHERRTGAELLAHLVDNRVEGVSAVAQLADRGLVVDACVLVAAIGGSQPAQQRLHLSLARRGIPNLLLRRSDVLYALLPPSDDAILTLRRRLGAEALLGVSDPVRAVDRISAARREAVWAARVARSSPDHAARYGDAALLSVLRDADEAQSVVDRTLGSLLDYDDEHGSNLVHTLDTFLTKQRSWQQVAATLGIHRQTVIYRVKRIEQITGRDLTRTADISELWLALRARDLIQAAP